MNFNIEHKLSNELNITDIGSTERVLNILIVDDSGPCRNMIERALNVITIQGCRICCDQASDGQEAVDMMRANLNVDTNLTRTSSFRDKKFRSVSSKVNFINSHSIYDLILMDYQMPKIDGPTAIRNIRELGYRGRIVGLTGNILGSEIETMQSSGANRVLSKPVKHAQLESLMLEL